jgi:hypothetical protein
LHLRCVVAGGKEKKSFLTFFRAGGCDEIAVWGEGHLKYYINWWVSVPTEVRGGVFRPFFWENDTPLRNSKIGHFRTLLAKNLVRLKKKNFF